MEKQTIMDQETLNQIKQELMERKKRIVEDLNDISREDSHEADKRSAKFPEYGDKPDENAQEISEYTTTVETERILEKTLSDIDKSLKSIDDGKYGICKYCGQEINPKRLLARPTASSCIECKTKLQNS
jgi:RNA polymerase-binding protein DksA